MAYNEELGRTEAELAGKPPGYRRVHAWTNDDRVTSELVQRLVNDWVERAEVRPKVERREDDDDYGEDDRRGDTVDPLGRRWRATRVDARWQVETVPEAAVVVEAVGGDVARYVAYLHNRELAVRPRLGLGLGTSGGVALTDELVQRLAAEAEEGYDAQRPRPRERDDEEDPWT